MIYFHMKFININNSYSKKQTICYWVHVEFSMYFSILFKSETRLWWNLQKLKIHYTQSWAKSPHLAPALHTWPRQVIDWIFILIKAVIVILHLRKHYGHVFLQKVLLLLFLCILNMQNGRVSPLCGIKDLSHTKTYFICTNISNPVLIIEIFRKWFYSTLSLIFPVMIFFLYWTVYILVWSHWGHQCN